MCGIAGLLAAEPSRMAVESALAAQTHRGPDDQGLYEGGGVILGARRLSIIDLEGGHQPVSNETDKVWAVLNGEIFNAPELRRSLESKGHQFRSRVDTEVLVHAYEEWGEDFVQHLRGMFAIAMWDEECSRLVLIRDRFGMKPLYYAQEKHRFSFASELPALRPLVSDTFCVRREALGDLFEVGYIPGPGTLYENILQVAPGHMLIVEKGEVQQQSYGTGPAQAPGRVSDEAFFEMLSDAVEAWSRSDVPVASLLSGGVDSGMLAALLARAVDAPLHTFHVSFEDAGLNESDFARLTADHLGSHHHEVRFDVSSFERLPEVIRSMGHPVCSATCLPQYLLYEACHQAGFKAVFTGEGADELLGGYHWYLGEQMLAPLLGLPQGLRKPLGRLCPAHPAVVRRMLRRGTASVLQRYALWQEVSGAEMRRNLLGLSGGSVADRWAEEPECCPENGSTFRNLQSLETHTRLVDFINFEVDRMSMAHSVEARLPFLDHVLWNRTETWPVHRLAGLLRNKRVLRSCGRSLLPAAISRRPKRGLRAPYAPWWRGPGPEWRDEAVSERSLKSTGFFEPALVAKLLREHREQRTNHGGLLMGVLTTQLLVAEG